MQFVHLWQGGRVSGMFHSRAGQLENMCQSLSPCLCVFVYSHIYVFLYLCIFVYGLFLGHTNHLPAPVFTKSWKTYVSPRR